MEHSELRHSASYSVNFHPITQAHSIFSHQHEPTKKAHDEILQRHRKTCAGKSQESPQLIRWTKNHQKDQTQSYDLQRRAYHRVQSLRLTGVQFDFAQKTFQPAVEENPDQQDSYNDRSASQTSMNYRCFLGANHFHPFSICFG